MDEKRFFIFNCNGEVVGNPKGYRTHRGAYRQAESHRTHTHRRIWDDFGRRANKHDNLVYSIKSENVITAIGWR